MFKSSRWRSEKNKIKVVFKLQFYATQVPQAIGDALAVSVRPADVGKTTVRLEKAIIREGSYYWENPIYETVKFVQEPKTGKINEKIYFFQVSNVTSKAGLVGEVSIDFAHYAEAIKPCTLSLPLKNSKSGAVLHVSIQRMQENFDQREVEENEILKIKVEDESLKAHLNNGDRDGSIKTNSAEAAPVNHAASFNAESNGNHKASSGSDILSSSEGSSGLNTPREAALKNNDVHQDPSSFLLASLSQNSTCQIPTANPSSTIYQDHQKSQWEWSVGSDHGLSTDDSTNDSQDTLPREGSLASDIEIEKLRTDLLVLARHAEVSDLELQTLRKQIVKESKRGQDLFKEVVSLKEERDALKEECERLNASQRRLDETKNKNKLLSEGGNPRALVEELRQELNYEKDLNANLRLQLQKTQESNSELLLAVRDLDELLEQKDGEISELSNKPATREDAGEFEESISKFQTDEDEEQKALEELVNGHNNAKEAHLLEQKIMDLYSEIEIYRRDKDELEMQMEQLALDYEILKQENHDMSYKLEQSQLQEQLKMQYECSGSFATINELEVQIENLENELQQQSKEFSDSLVTINELEALIEKLENELKKQSKEFSDSLATVNELGTHVKNLEEELEKQAQGFEADLEAVTRNKVQLEQRAIQAEETLRMTRWKNASTAERLQEEFKRLSMQMASTFEANEKLAMKALTEASELRLQKDHIEEMLQKANEELHSVREGYEVKLCEHSSQISLKTHQIEQVLLEIEDKSKQLELQKKHEEELHNVFSQGTLTLRAEIERLSSENNFLLKQAGQMDNLRAEFEHMKASTKEMEVLLQRGNIERNELGETIASARKEAEKSLEELNAMRHLKDENETRLKSLQSELETLRTQYDELKHTLFEDELEKEKLRKQVFQLKTDLKKKEDAFSNIEKKLKDSNGRSLLSNGVKAPPRNNKFAPEFRGSKEVTNLRERMKLLEGQIKLKETALETSTTLFLEKEKDLQNKIAELESRLEELSQSSTGFCENPFEKVADDTEGTPLNGSMSEEVKDPNNHLRNMAWMSQENGIKMSTTKCSDEVMSPKELKASAFDSRYQGNLDELLSEMESLKQRNKSMEGELKEMQERYSEISLKFAEVEGERQQLVMTLRNLKNAKKG